MLFVFLGLSGFEVITFGLVICLDCVLEYLVCWFELIDFVIVHVVSRLGVVCLLVYRLFVFIVLCLAVRLGYSVLRLI